MFPRIVIETVRGAAGATSRGLHRGRTVLPLALLCSFAAFGWATLLSAQEYDEYGNVLSDEYEGIEARLWFDRGVDPVVDRGERLRIYYRVSEDAYAAVFHIDTDGHVRLVFPRNPDQEYRLRGQRDYRLLFDGSSYWRVSDHPGRGYFFVVASATPLDFADIYYSNYDREWDLRQIGSEVYRDPYLAMDDYVSSLIPDWEYGDYGLDVSEYSVGSSYEYPRFMCYECHGYRPYSAWNPYYAACTSFRVVIWDDPFYFPYYSGRYYSNIRYPASRVVYNGRRFAGRPRFEFKERAGDESSQPIVMPRTNPGESAPRRRTTGGGVVTAPSRGGSIVDAPGREDGSVDTRRRDQSGLSGSPATEPRRGSPALRGTSPASGSADAARRPVLERRVPTSGAVRTRPSSPARSPAARGTRGRTGGDAPARGTATTRGTRPGNTTTRGRVIRPGDNPGGGVLRGFDRSGSRATGAVRERNTTTRGRVSRPGGTATRGAPTRGSVTRTPTRSGGSVISPGRSRSSSGASMRAPTRSGGSRGVVIRPPNRSSGSAGAASRAPTRSRGSVARPPSRSSGASARSSTGSSGSSGRVQVRRRGGGG